MGVHSVLAAAPTSWSLTLAGEKVGLMGVQPQPRDGLLLPCPRPPLGCHLEVETPWDPRTCCRLTPSMLTPLTASTTSPAIITRSQTSLVVPRATCLTLRPKCANWPRKCLSAPAGTVARRTASAATTAMRTALVEPQLLRV